MESKLPLTGTFPIDTQDGPAPEWVQDPQRQGGSAWPGGVTQRTGPAGLPGLLSAWAVLGPSSPL